MKTFMCVQGFSFYISFRLVGVSANIWLFGVFFTVVIHFSTSFTCHLLFYFCSILYKCLLFLLNEQSPGGHIFLMTVVVFSFLPFPGRPLLDMSFCPENYKIQIININMFTYVAEHQCQFNTSEINNKLIVTLVSPLILDREPPRC